MKIELRNIKMQIPQASDFISFSASLYNKGRRAAIVYTHCKDEELQYKPTSQDGIGLILEAREYLKQQAKPYHARSAPVKDTRNYLSDQIFHLSNSYYNDRLKNFRYGKLSPPGIMLDNNGQFRWFGFELSIQSILSSPDGENSLKALITKQVIPHLKKGDKLLNLNLPKSIQKLFPKEVIIKPVRIIKSNLSGAKKKL